MEDKLRTTHIIIPDQSYRSQRLGTAQEWGIQVVYPQWIREMALQHPVSSRQDIEEAACSATEPDNFQSLAVSQTAGPSSDDFADETKPLNGCRVHIPRRVEV